LRKKSVLQGSFYPKKFLTEGFSRGKLNSEFRFFGMYFLGLFQKNRVNHSFQITLDAFQKIQRLNAGRNFYFWRNQK